MQKSVLGDFAPWYQSVEVEGEWTTKLPYSTAVDYHEMRTLLPTDVSGKRILDVGCNAGMNSIRLALAGAKVCGVERDTHYFEQAVLLDQYFKVGENLILINEDIADFVFPKERFDYVLMLAVLYHLRPKVRDRLLDDICLHSDYAVFTVRRKQYDAFDKYIELFKQRGAKCLKAEIGERRLLALIQTS